MEEVNTYHQSDEQLLQEKQWIEKAKKDPEAFQPLYEKYYLQIHQYLFKRLASDEETKELTSKVFARALFNIKKFEFRGIPISAWLYRIAYNELAQHYREKKKQRSIRADEKEIKNALNLTELSSGEPVREEEIRLLENALSELTPEEAELVQLRFFEARPFKEVGEITGVTENNARVRTHRLLEKLKHMLEALKRKL